MMINTVGGSPMMMPGLQPSQGVRPTAPTGGADAARAVDDQSQRAAQPRTPEAPARASVEAKGMFVDMYA